MSRLPKPSSLPKLNFQSKINPSGVLPSKNLVPVAKPSTTSLSNYALTKTAKCGSSQQSEAPKTKSVAATKAQPLRPVNRILPTTSGAAQSRAPKRPATTINPVQAKISRRSVKNIRKSVGRLSTKAPVAKKPAPYDYKARFTLLNERHTKLVAEHKQLKLTHANSAETIENLEDNVKILTSDLEQKNEALILLNKTVEDLKRENIDIKNRLETSTKEVDRLTECKVENERNLASQKRIIDDLTPVVNDLTLTNQNQKTQIHILEKDLEDSKKAIQDHIQKLQEKDLERRKLNNDIQNLKGKIRVFCRIRPPLKQEQARPCFSVQHLEDNTMEICKNRIKAPLQFTFDQVFTSTSTQADIFVELSELVQSSVDGYNVCIFAYGQTGSGKTYTMEGEYGEESQGMIPRSISLIFERIAQAKNLHWTYNVKASFLEIYKEKVQDLLRKHQDAEIKSLDQIAQPITSADDLCQIMFQAQKNRTTSATESNEYSSRSHSITTIVVEGHNHMTNERTRSFLNLVDLAGSEKIQTIGTDRVDETKNINKSLHTLTHVIMSLKERREYVPYRDSKLTYLLKSSLGGNSKTLMIVNVAPFEDCYEESTYSLRFATQVSQCRVGAIKKNKIRTGEVKQTPSKQ